MDTLPSARREFLALARLTLMQCNMDLSNLNTSQLSSAPQLELAFTMLGTEFSFVHSLDPPAEGLMLITCLLGPLPRNRELEACAQLLTANYELSSTHLSAFALDGNSNVIYTHSHVVRTADAQNLAALIDGLSALSMWWRGDQLPSVRELSLPGQKAYAAFALA